MSNWFIGERNIKRTRMVPYTEVWSCPEVGCSGNMAYTGQDLLSPGGGHIHKCNVCVVEWVITGALYPRVFFEEEKIDA